jgi:hypothetical protein
VSTYFDIRDLRYRTELSIGTSDIGLKKAESDIQSDIGINFFPISYIRHPNIYKSAQWLRGKALAREKKGLEFRASGCENIGYRNGLRCRYRNDSFQNNIFSSDIGIMYRCRCQMSDIADIKIYVDAHLCIYASRTALC